MLEWIIIPEKTGNRYNLKNKFGKSIGRKNPLGFGLYAFGVLGDSILILKVRPMGF